MSNLGIGVIQDCDERVYGVSADEGERVACVAGFVEASAQLADESWHIAGLVQLTDVWEPVPCHQRHPTPQHNRRTASMSGLGSGTTFVRLERARATPRFTG